MNENLIKVGIELKYLPDYNEEYSVQLKPGLGSGTLGFSLEDGWKLTSVNMSSDSKIPELISSLANLVGAVRGGAGTGGGGSSATPSTKGKAASGLADDLMTIIVDTRPDVPLGFYEAIIATDPNGRKTLFGWRYVGFMPFEGCPVQPILQAKTVCCNEDELWGIVATPNAIKFDRLSSIRNLDGNWPYRYKSVKQADKGGNGDLAPPPNTVVHGPSSLAMTVTKLDLGKDGGRGKITVVFGQGGNSKDYYVTGETDIIIDDKLVTLEKLSEGMSLANRQKATLQTLIHCVVVGDTITRLQSGPANRSGPNHPNRPGIKVSGCAGVS